MKNNSAYSRECRTVSKISSSYLGEIIFGRPKLSLLERKSAEFWNNLKSDCFKFNEIGDNLYVY